MLDIDASLSHFSLRKEISPTLTFSRGKGFWITSHRRRMHAHEALKLQGIPCDEIQAGISDNELRQLAGNAMTVPILVHIMDNLIPMVL